MANIFTYDIHCKALWRFESGALVTDSIGGNTLTNHGASADSSYYMEGSYSSLFERYEYMNITDSNLSTGFPFKSGDTNKKISVCFWARVARVYDGALLSKFDFSSGLRCFSIRYTSAGTFFIQLGYNSGGSYTNYTHGSTFPKNTWQHITFSYDNSDRSYALRLRDASGNIVGTDLTGTAANDISITTAPLEVNSYNGGNNAQWGRIDELVFFDDIITAAEATQIAQGNYHEGLSQLAVYYNAGTDETSSWTNPARVWDHSLTDYANQLLEGSGYSGYLLSTGIYTSDPGDIVTILQVEVGAKYYDSQLQGSLFIYPYVGGSSSNYYIVSNYIIPTEYHDITNCTNAPDPWTWDDIVALDLRTRSHNNYFDVSSSRIYEIWLRITYVPQANEPIPEQLHYYKNGIVNINIYPFSAGIDNYMNITYSGTQVGYIPIVSGNGTGSHPTDLRIYKDGIYTVQSER